MLRSMEPPRQGSILPLKVETGPSEWLADSAALLARKFRMAVIFARAAWLVLFAALFLSFGAIPASAQDIQAPASASGSEPLTVGVYVHPPFVMEVEGEFTGMAIDLWEWLSGRLHLQSEYVEYSNITKLIDAVMSGEADIAVTNLTVTRDRAERIDFTHPWFDAGQRIMVNEDRSGGFWDVVAGLRETGHLRAYAWIGFVIVVATVLVTLFDRHFDEEFPRRWRNGLAESFYTVMSVATSGKSSSRKNLFGWVGRIWQGLWLLCGIAVLAYFTSSVTSVMTTLSLTNQINSVADLSGRPIGVHLGSVSEDYARQAGFDIRSFEHLEEAVEALSGGRIDAIIGDAPVLEYYAHTNPGETVAVVGPIFAPDKYAFGLPRRSELRRPLSVELIGARESGLIATMKERYFGVDP